MIKGFRLCEKHGRMNDDVLQLGAEVPCPAASNGDEHGVALPQGASAMRVRIGALSGASSWVQTWQLPEGASDKASSSLGWALPSTLREYAATEDDRKLAKIHWVCNHGNLMNESNRAAKLVQQNPPTCHWCGPSGSQSGNRPFVELRLSPQDLDGWASAWMADIR